MHNSCFGSPGFGQQVHEGFGNWFDRNLGRLPDIDRTAVGKNGVDLTFLTPVRGLRDRAGRVHPDFIHAELKPQSWPGWNRFHDQLGNWRANGMSGDVGLFMYDAKGDIFFIGTF